MIPHLLLVKVHFDYTVWQFYATRDFKDIPQINNTNERLTIPTIVVELDIFVLVIKARSCVVR